MSFCPVPLCQTHNSRESFLKCWCTLFFRESPFCAHLLFWIFPLIPQLRAWPEQTQRHSVQHVQSTLKNTRQSLLFAHHIHKNRTAPLPSWTSHNWSPVTVRQSNWSVTPFIIGGFWTRWWELRQFSLGLKIGNERGRVTWRWSWAGCRLTGRIVIQQTRSEERSRGWVRLWVVIWGLWLGVN